ncbi:hypothetical protein DICVIV_04234 [Dictyocaulus viviparus]|uniref:Uncharacterized protein n=1 Tax=Dictyocaulus viviparus TaxID=29172 RepID=A0A0D8Y0P7_DICVI|nr:hypothetical protein DICVIV_04234 [Dictyocaulus viviparus]
MVNRARTPNAIRLDSNEPTMDSEENVGENHQWQPRAIHFEEVRKDLSDKEARARKKLHDDTRVYSSTEQFLYKAMVSDSGRMTRSRTKVMMENRSPPFGLQNREALKMQSDRQHSAPKCVSGSSVADVVELTIIKQQEIENSRSSRRFKGKRRSMLHALPGPISYPKSLSRMREDMYNECMAKLAPFDSSFDPNEIISAVKSGDLLRFRKATECFCRSGDKTDRSQEICSLISKWRDENGGTLIHLICRGIKCSGTHEADDLIHSLAKYAPNLLRVQDTLLKIPLHIAVEKGEVCRVSKLLQLGSPICWLDNHSLSPLDITYSYGNVNILKMLLNSGATFHELLANEERLPPTRRGHLFKTLLKHSCIMGGILRGARKKVLRNIKEAAFLSPIFIVSLRDELNPVFRFFHTPPSPGLGDALQSPLLFTYLAVNRPVTGKRGVEWLFRCHGPIQCFAPMLNGRLLEPMTGKVSRGVPTDELLTDTFIFFCPLRQGFNELTFKLHESYRNIRYIFAAQVIMMKKTNTVHSHV